LAHLVQGLILLITAAATVYAADFSHALHLKLKPECGSCHVKAATSTKLEDNLLPEAQSCKPCHESREVRSKPTVTRLSQFNHEFHLKLGNIAPVLKAAVQSKSYLADPGNMLQHLDTRNACLACHRGVDQSAGALTKAHFPHMADCLVCHNRIDPPFSCETCHTKGDATLKPVSHTGEYLDSHTRKSLEKVGCAVCHGQKFTCLGCH
jgi:hypothetical protein